MINTSNKGGSRDVHWVCQCSCGNVKEISGHNLRKGNTKSCGCKEGSRKETGVSASRHLFGRYKYRAKNKGLIWKISFKDFVFLTSQNCYFCGSLPVNIVASTKQHRFNGNYVYNGLDRLDNNLGYTIENVVPCCFTCNRAKNSMSIDDFFAWIHKILKHNLL